MRRRAAMLWIGLALGAWSWGCSRLPSKDELLDPDGDAFDFEEDCDDDDATIYLGATERCDGVDNDCDGEVDEADAADSSTWYADADGDGHGDPLSTTTACQVPEGHVASADDCDDTHAAANPGAAELPYDGLDNDCDASTPDDDLDGDGVGSVQAGGTDCDDEDASISPGAAEVCGDGEVNDCDGDAASAMAGCGLGGTMSLASADLKLEGESSDDLAGRSVGAAGDVDGDGLADLVIGAPESTWGSGGGATYLVLGATVVSAGASALDLASSDLRLTGEVGADESGSSVTGVGDVDGDGLADVLIGAPQSGAGRGGGAAYLALAAGALNTVELSLDLASADVRLTGEASSDAAGSSVAGAGDVDGDGLADMVVGAPESAAGSGGGAVYLVLGATAVSSGVSSLDLASADLRLTGEASSDAAGSSVAGAGDVDGDGRGDLVIGAPESTAGSGGGAAYVVLGATMVSSGSSSMDLSLADLRLTGEEGDNVAGGSVSGAGDVDGDSLSDVLVGASLADEVGNDGGAAYLLLGGGTLSYSAVSIDLSSADRKLTGEAANDRAGRSVAAAGDVDRDGLGDVLIGADGEMTGGSYAGAVYLLLAGGALAGSSASVSLASADLKLTGEASYDRAGYAVSGAGDVDGDRFADLVVGAYNADPGGSGSGSAYLLFGGGY